MMKEKTRTFARPDVPYRRRGRPAGKNRIPLSREERRARNAHYERERRNETAELMSKLNDAANCDPNTSNAELLTTVINRIQRAAIKKSDDITELERINANLEAQIVNLQDRLGHDDAALELSDGEDTDMETTGPHSISKSFYNSNCYSETYDLRKQLQKTKRKRPKSILPEIGTKTESETCSVDSGIEMRGQTVSLSAVCEQDQNNIECLIQTQQLPVEITEENDHGESQSHMEQLQTELYNQIYNSETQSSEESMTKYVATLSAQSQSIPSIERLTRSLILVPPIVPPQEIPPDSQEHSQSDLTSLQNELRCDFDLTKECDYLQQNDDQEPTLDFLTDAEKELVLDWIRADFLETSKFSDDSQMQVRNYAIDDLSSH